MFHRMENRNQFNTFTVRVTDALESVFSHLVFVFCLSIYIYKLFFLLQTPFSHSYEANSSYMFFIFSVQSQ